MNKKASPKILLLIILGSIFIIILLYCLFSYAQRKDNYETVFQRNQEEIVSVVNFLIDLEYESVHINSRDGTMFVGWDDGGIIAIDEDLWEAIRFLQNRRYSVIGKRNGCVYFVRWSNKDVGRGFVYSIDGHIPDEETFIYLTRLEPLSYENWYYYEEDFNEWRRRQ